MAGETPGMDGHNEHCVPEALPPEALMGNTPALKGGATYSSCDYGPWVSADRSFQSFIRSRSGDQSAAKIVRRVSHATGLGR